MSEKTIPVSPASVPGVPEGKPPVAPVATGNPPGAIPRLPSDPNAAKKSVVPFGGNAGGRPRNDRLVPGSPEAKEADRKAAAIRAQNYRARQAALRQPPPIPPAATVESVATNQTPVEGVDSVATFEGDEWLAADLQNIAPELLNLLESLDIADQRDLAEEGKLPARVVEQIAKDAAWPVPTKQTLQRSSPQSIAKLFNILRVPRALKDYVTTCPLIIYLIVRRLQNKASIRKLIAEDQAKRAAETPPPTKTP